MARRQAHGAHSRCPAKAEVHGVPRGREDSISAQRERPSPGATALKAQCLRASRGLGQQS